MNRAHSDRGSISTEVVIIAPIALVLLCLIALVGRTTTARQSLDGAARDAARAASLQRDPAGAAEAARTAAATVLATTGTTCASTTVEVDTSRFEPGGQITVTVGCAVALSDLGLLGLPGTRNLSATSTSPVDTYRAVR